MSTLAHGGVWGAVVEVGVVFAFLVVCGFFLWRSSKREQEQSNQSDAPGE